RLQYEFEQIHNKGYQSVPKGQPSTWMQSEDGIFLLNSNSGEIRLDSVLTTVEYRVFALKVKVKDSGQSPLSQTSLLRVIVNHTIPFGDLTSDGQSSILKSKLGLVLLVVGLAL